MWYRLGQWMLRVILRVYHRAEVQGLDRVPRQGPFLLVGNHISYLDPFYIAAQLPQRISFMAKAESFSHPFTQWFLRKVDAFPVRREEADVRAMRSALARLRNDQVVGLFPEGRRREAEPPTELKGGASYLALRAQVPVIPVRIEGTDRALPRKGRWIRPAKVRIYFGEPIQKIPAGKNREDQERIHQMIMSAFRQLAEQKVAE